MPLGKNRRNRVMIDVVCVNDTFPEEYQKIYSEYGIETPKKGVMYTIRAAIRHSTGDIGVLLEEIKNPDIPYRHPILGQQKMEPTWSIKRFRHLDGSFLTADEVRELIINLDFVNNNN